MTAAEVETTRQQDKAQERAHLGIWVFLATEVLFFSALFLAFMVDRYTHRAAFVAAMQKTNVAYGTINSIILVTSSCAAAIAMKSAMLGERKDMLRCLLGTIGLGVCFLGVKALEYRSDIAEGLFPGANFSLKPPETQLFWGLYWIITGVHAIHLAIGIAALGTLVVALNRGGLKLNAPAVQVVGLYWHFVDVVWIFVYPLLYLWGRSG